MKIYTDNKFMKKIKICILLLLAFLCVACDNCETTYRKEVGVGYVFRYDSTGCYPVAGAKITVEHIHWDVSLKGNKTKTVASATYTTNAEGQYQVRFVEKGCYNGEEIYCDVYKFYCNNEEVFGFGIGSKYIEIHAQDNIFKFDNITIK